MKTRYLSLLALGPILATAPLSAQPFTLGLRHTVNESSERFAGADLRTGFGFGSTIAMRVMEHVHVYAGWDWLHFSPGQSFAGPNTDFEETGYTLGLRFEHPLRATSRLAMRIEAGGTWKHLEIEDNAGNIIADSGHEPGFELGAGLAIPLSDRWLLTPMTRYRQNNNDFIFASQSVEGRLRYFGVEMGIGWRF